LQGQATFHIGSDDNIRIVNKNEGVMLPAGTCYWFLSSAPENLVMMRIGAASKPPAVWRAFPDGRPFDSETIMERATKRKKNRVFAPGQFFG
jgi:mannose-6-phosphate isomerase-like protein (cupin superfamily)